MNDYDREAKRTESPITVDLANRATANVRLLHGVMGIVTEAGELMDQLKGHIFYDKMLDAVNVQEELGDLEWYMAIVRSVLGVSQGHIQQRNVEKLRRRYPETYSHVSALNRDLESEREALTSGTLGVELVSDVNLDSESDSVRDVGALQSCPSVGPSCTSEPLTMKEEREIRNLSRSKSIVSNLTSNDIRIICRALGEKYGFDLAAIAGLKDRLQVLLEITERKEDFLSDAGV